MIGLVGTSILAWLLIQQYIVFYYYLLFAWNIKLFLAYELWNLGSASVRMD